MKPKILKIDIETAPGMAYVWSRFDKFIPDERIIRPSRMICFAAQWVGDKEMHFWAEWGGGGRRRMLRELHKLLCEADLVVHYNGQSFDMPRINAEFAKDDIPPPSPYKQIDLYRQVKKNFKFFSGKMDFVTKEMKIGQKVKHEGFSLWTKVEDGDAKALAKMERYNRGDVRLLGSLYRKLLPWIRGVQSLAPIYNRGKLACPNCGSTSHTKEGHAYTQVGKFQRVRCTSCGTYYRDGTNLLTAAERKAMGRAISG